MTLVFVRLACLAGWLGLAGAALAQDATPPVNPTPPAATAPAQPADPAAAAPAPAIDPQLVVAKIGAETITRQDVIDSIAGFPEEKRQYAMEKLDNLFPQLLERLIFLKLAVAKGRAMGLAEDAEVKTIVAAAEEDAIRRTYFEREVKARVTDESVKARYDELVKAGTFVELKARHILVATQEEAAAIIAELQAGGDFAAIAKTKSTDTASGAQGGDLGWFTRRTMVKEFADAAFAMAPGEISKVPVKSQFGWHIINVEEKRDRGFDDVKDAIREALIDEARDAIATQLREEAGVEIIDASGGAKPTP